MAGSPKTSVHLANVRFEVTITDFLPARKDRLLNNKSVPSLSKDMYPSSSAITKSYFSNRF
jgi:hypothetical protein